MINCIKALFTCLILMVLVGCVEEGTEDTSSSSSTSTATSSETPPPNYPDKLYISYITPIDTTTLPKVDANSTTTLNTELNNTIISTVAGNNGGYVYLIGDKDFNGLAQTIRGACIVTTTGTEMVVVMDDVGRPTQLSSGNGKIVSFDWNNQMVSEHDGIFSCNQLKNNDPTVRNAKNRSSIGNELQVMGIKEDLSGLAGCEKLSKLIKDTGIGVGFVGTLLSRIPSTVPLGIALAAVGTALGLSGGDLSQQCKDKTKSCNADIPYSGGVGQQNYYFRMGKSYGNTGLSYDFYSVPDRIVIRYEGQTLYDTGCRSQGQSVSFSFSGSSEDIEVIVTGDCSNNGSTQWDFNMSCP